MATIISSSMCNPYPQQSKNGSTIIIIITITYNTEVIYKEFCIQIEQWPDGLA